MRKYDFSQSGGYRLENEIGILKEAKGELL
jgi:hypothetical protein